MIKRCLFAFCALLVSCFQLITPSSVQAMGWEEGSAEKIALHAAVGAAVAAVADGDIVAGASAAALNEALLPHLTKALEEAGLDGVLDKDAILVLASQAVGGVVGGTDGAVITGKATEHNYLKHPRDPTEEERDAIYERIEDCGNDLACQASVIDDANNISELFGSQTELALCDGDFNCKTEVTQKYLEISHARHEEL